jgi:hypothetical protein
MSKIPRPQPKLTDSPSRRMLENITNTLTSHFIGAMTEMSPSESAEKLKYFPK